MLKKAQQCLKATSRSAHANNRKVKRTTREINTIFRIKGDGKLIGHAEKSGVKSSIVLPNGYKGLRKTTPAGNFHSHHGVDFHEPPGADWRNGLQAPA
jgi:hypothetical protein